MNAQHPETIEDSLNHLTAKLDAELAKGGDADSATVAELMFNTTVHGAVFALIHHPAAANYLAADAIVSGRTAEVIVQWVDGDTMGRRLDRYAAERDAARLELCHAEAALRFEHGDVISAEEIAATRGWPGLFPAKSVGGAP